MKLALEDSRRMVLRFDEGEEVLEGIKNFMQQRGLSACVFYGIGACSLAELAYFDLADKIYKKTVLKQNLEIASLIGNGGRKDGQAFVHAHAVLGDKDLKTYGGHAARLVVSATCEIFLITLNGQLNREIDPTLSLSLLI